MDITLNKDIREHYPVCRRAIGPELWDRTVLTFKGAPGMLPDWLARNPDSFPSYAQELSRLEFNYRALEEPPGEFSRDSMTLNPSLRALELGWKGLCAFFGNDATPSPMEGQEIVLLWRSQGQSYLRPATSNDLLAMKAVAEGLYPIEVAREGGVQPSAVLDILDRAAQDGILIKPRTLIVRSADFPVGEGVDKEYLSADFFTLQWHITHACDLHCRHCYDRSRRDSPEYETALKVLDDLEGFCSSQKVRGQITFTGGHPLLYPRFNDIYREAAQRGFNVAIAGNPDSRQRIEDLLDIVRPSFYQVSLEGLEEHNDHIRGEGHYQRVKGFLDILGELGIYSMVMLTLTDRNMPEVIPLAEQLRGRTDSFNFNRLCTFGEGANLGLPDKEDYRAFLEEYLEARKHNPVMGIKDNLLNIILEGKGALFGGCTGHGCGAAFNFVSLLPDGEVHACRKFPSLIGNIHEGTLADIYDSALADKYRAGPSECISCRIRPVCGGCQAVVSGSGLESSTNRDPFCFI